MLHDHKCRMLKMCVFEANDIGEVSIDEILNKGVRLLFLRIELNSQ